MRSKDILGWSKVKVDIDKEEVRPDVKIGEVRWCAIGHNVGSEMDGKGELFSRPVLILKFISTNTRLVIPLTHSEKLGRHLLEVDFNGEKIKARLDQIRIVDVKRIKGRLGEISENKFKNIFSACKEFLFPKKQDENVNSYVGSKALIKNENNEILIVKEVWSGKWGFPGGRIQESEIQINIKECLLREIKEELGGGVRLQVSNYFDTMFRELGNPRNPDIKYAFAICFECDYFGGDIKLQEIELSDYAWVNANTYLDYEFISGYKNVLDKYFKKNI